MVTARINTPGVIGRVAVQQAQRTVVADPKFKPKPNVAITEILGVTASTRQQGDTLVYDANTDSYISGPVSLVATQTVIENVNGGSF